MYRIRCLCSKELQIKDGKDTICPCGAIYTKSNRKFEKFSKEKFREKETELERGELRWRELL